MIPLEALFPKPSSLETLGRAARFSSYPCGRFWNFGLEKPLSIQSLVSCSVGAWKIQMSKAVQNTEAWPVAFQRETKDSTWPSVWESGVWSAGAEKSAMTNKRPEPLK